MLLHPPPKKMRGGQHQSNTTIRLRINALYNKGDE
jgi:hypothetical protein